MIRPLLDPDVFLQGLMVVGFAVSAVRGLLPW